MEFSPELFDKVSEILPGYNGFFEKGMDLVSWGITDCQVIFVRKNIKTGKNGKISIYRQSAHDVGFMQFLELQIGDKKTWLGSLHGKTLPGNKLDTPVRLKQSEKIINFFKDKIGPKIIGGDFNLMPDTKSVKMFEQAGYRNLIRDFGIQETRNNLSWKQFPNEDKQHFADYVFVSPDVKVKKFEIPYNEISDHLPQVLDFEV